MSCPRFPYGRFNFGISNKKLYPRTNSCSNRLWTLTLKDTVQNSGISNINIPKNTKITQEISPELSRSPNAHSIQALVGYAKNLCQPAGGLFSTLPEESALWI